MRPLFNLNIATIDALANGDASGLLDDLTDSGERSLIEVAGDRDAVPDLAVLAGGPEQVAAWWSDLRADERTRLIIRAPDLIGNTDGVPAWARDRANREMLARDLERLRAMEAGGTLRGPDRKALENAENIVEYLASHQRHADPISGEVPAVQLYIYDPSAFRGDGRVAISLGDLDTADHTAVMVPGLTTHAASIDPAESQQLHDEARWAGRGGDSVAVLHWIGYDAPSWRGVGDTGHFLDVRKPDLARAGAELLADDVAGLRAMRSAQHTRRLDTHLSVIGHSYGSTTTAIAANEMGLAADDIVLLGSPGAGSAETAADLPTGSSNTWVGSASHDPVTFLGESGRFDRVERLGSDPAMEGFGAQRFAAEHPDRGLGVSEVPSPWFTIPEVKSIGDHLRYYTPGGESLYNVAAIAAGRYDEVQLVDGRRHRLLQSPLHVGTCTAAGVIVYPCPGVRSPVNVLPVDEEVRRVPNSGAADPARGWTHEPTEGLVPAGG